MSSLRVRRLRSVLVLVSLSAVAITARVDASQHCTVAVTQADGLSLTFAYQADGFEANETIHFVVVVADGQRVFETEGVADAEGRYSGEAKTGEDDPSITYRLLATGRSCAAETSFRYPLPDTATSSDPAATTPASPLVLVGMLTGLVACLYLLSLMNKRTRLG